MKILNRLAECRQWILRIVIRRYIRDIAREHNIKHVENIKIRWLGEVILTEYADDYQYKEWKELDRF